jgi:hypothetical protein
MFPCTPPSSERLEDDAMEELLEHAPLGRLFELSDCLI